jgi:hypothetical protein
VSPKANNKGCLPTGGTWPPKSTFCTLLTGSTALAIFGTVVFSTSHVCCVVAHERVSPGASRDSKVWSEVGARVDLQCAALITPEACRSSKI